MVEAVRLMGSGAPPVSMIGGGRMEEELRSRIVADKLAIRLHGIVDEAAELLKAFDCLVLSSRTEGTPIILLEAITAEVPVIATRVGGIPDTVAESEAVLVDAESPQALADAIRKIRADPDAALVRAAGAANRLRAESDVAAWVDAYERVYALCAH
jgi:glycosyltransferase involved in cell wall biosynthesis